jgi:hypothetical protein
VVDIEQTMAGFLLTRGDYAWVGWSWIGCSSGSQTGQEMYPRPPQLDVDYGVPTSTCSETVPGQSGVFVRSYSNAAVSMDCNTYIANITMTA